MIGARCSMLILSAACAIQAIAGAAAPAQEVVLTVGTGTVVDCPAGIARVAASSPDIVDVVTASTREVFFHAKAVGQATLIVWSKTGERTTYTITVEPNLEPLKKLLRETFPDEQIDLRASRESLALVGRARSQAVSDRALALVAASVKGAVSNLQIAPPGAENQVVLKVRFAELNRSASTEFAVNLLSTGALNTVGQISTGQFPAAHLDKAVGGANPSANFALSDILNIFAFRPDLNLAAVIRDLQSRGLLEILAEPNLVAIPVAQGGASTGAITVQYREFGIRLSFLPQITPHHTIRLHVRPEVSSLDPSHGVVVSGFNIPALTTRRVETDIELGEGQSFVIAGLIDDRVVENLSQVPGLAHIPLLGALFRSRSETKSRTELIVIVTPETALPVAGAIPGPVMPKPFLAPAPGPRKP